MEINHKEHKAHKEMKTVLFLFLAVKNRNDFPSPLRALRAIQSGNLKFESESLNLLPLPFRENRVPELIGSGQIPGFGQ